MAVLSLALPFSRAASGTQTLALLVAMATISAVSTASVGEVVRLLADIAAIFRQATPFSERADRHRRAPCR